MPHVETYFAQTSPCPFTADRPLVGGRFFVCNSAQNPRQTIIESAQTKTKN